MAKIVFMGDVLLHIQNSDSVFDVMDKNHLCVTGYPSIMLIETRSHVVKMLQSAIDGKLSGERLTPMYCCKVHATVKELEAGKIEITLKNPSWFGLLGMFRRLWIANNVGFDIPIYKYIWTDIRVNPGNTLTLLAVYWRPLKNVFDLR